MAKAEKPIYLKITANLEGFETDVERPDIAVYLFNRFGRLVAKQPLAKTDEPGIGEAAFSFKGRAEKLIVKVGPDLKEEDIKKLERRKPFKDNILAVPGKETKLKLKIPKPFWECWCAVPYIVKGTVLKQENGQNLPVCYGTVDIYEVDPIFRCILKLPELVIERIRDAIIDIIIDPPPIIIEKIPEIIPEWPGNGDDDGWCGTKPKGPLPPPPEEVDVMKILEELPSELSFAKERFQDLPTARKRINAELKRLDLAEKQAFLDSEPIEGVKVSQVLYSDTDQFRKLLVDKLIVIRYWLCWWPWIYWIWWPWCWRYNLDLIGTAELNPDGSFNKVIWLPPCYKDIPDIWFKVKQKINGVEKVICTRYPVPCHTYWNHPSNTAVTLIATNPSAFACYPDPGDGLDNSNPWVVVMAVGNYSLKRIYGTGASSLPADSAKIGLYESIYTGLESPLTYFTDGPFGGRLELRLLFSRALETMSPKPVKFYRIKYRVNGTGDWEPLTHEVVRHYSHFDTATNSLEFPAYQLGPKTVDLENSLFEIPPKDPPNKATEPDADWYVINVHTDLINGYLNSANEADGFVEFKVEIFDEDGTRINPATYGGGIPFFIPDNNDIWNTVTMVDPATVNPDLVVDDPEDTSFKTFIFRLVIENRKANAFIEEPNVTPSGGLLGDCGFIRYQSTDTDVDLPFHARQHRMFAMYRFRVIRKTTEKFKQKDQAGNMSSVFNPVVSLATLLAGCSDGEAAFSENLYVWHMAYNGWTRLSSLDASHVRAFALAPAPPSP